MTLSFDVNVYTLRKELKEAGWTKRETICPECSERKSDIAKFGQILLEIPDEKFEERQNEKTQF